MTDSIPAFDPGTSTDEILRLVEGIGLTGTWGWAFAANRQAWSAGLHDILRVTPGRVEASYQGLLSLVHPDDRPLLESAVEVREWGILGDHTVRILRPDGVLRTVMMRGEVFHAPDGRPLRAAGVVVDVSERELLARAHRVQTLQRRALFEQSQTYFATIAHFPILSYPREFLELTGLRNEDLLENWLRAIPREEQGYWRDEVPALWQSGKPFTLAFKQILANGDRVPFRLTVAVSRGGDGTILNWNGVTAPSGVHPVQGTGALRHCLEQAIEGRHLRAARALLGCSMAGLAAMSGLSLSTIRRLEEDGEGPSSRARHAAVAALRAAGIVFCLTEETTIAVAARG
ncbi:hypothetical protein OPKNFCMD_2132 [Methylobacterium crusticola]|uniref:histidine kinase n=1 Tax=Methylobacterium crusticola TaxID=1697972 RepID=A0ABQ4QXV9_9HYPH|nr:PAS domain-containing protein [Methylobacterium crusticola]GJD49402.1 hypothetical protein OPKNFCMD_2132 [Methylobacterium crusticola]